MKKTIYFSLLGLWILFATSLLTHWLLTHLKAPASLPESFWLWLGDIFSIQDAEGQVALEIWFGLGFSFIVVSVCTLVGWLVWQNTLTNRSSGRAKARS